MPIASTNLRIRRSTKTASAGNTTTQPDPAASLGLWVSTTDLPDSGLGTMFPTMASADNANSAIDAYVCYFVYNQHATLTATGTVVYLVSDPPGGGVYTLAADPTAASLVTATVAQALTAASIRAPGAQVVGLTFTAPSTPGTGVLLGDIGPGQVKAFWVRSQGANTAAATEVIEFGVACSTLA